MEEPASEEPRKRARKASRGRAQTDPEDPFLDCSTHPMRVVEKAVEALLAKEHGGERLRELFLGEGMDELVEAVKGEGLPLLQAYRLLLAGVAEGLRLAPAVFERAALAQEDALWPPVGSDVVMIRGHCDLRDQSLCRRSNATVRLAER
jgi:hypothetical protein